MKTSPPYIACPRCLGAGRVPLAVQFRETLKALRKGPSTARQLHALLGATSPTSVNNWLESLRRFGLVRRTKVNREWVYKPTKP